jgi:hypothetical protein
MNRGVRRQRGWVGILMLLVVVLIVAFLAKDALLKYLGSAATVQRAAPKEAPGAAAGERSSSAVATPMDRARSLQDTLRKESEKRGEEQ